MIIIAPVLAWAMLFRQEAPQAIRLKAGDVVEVYIASGDPSTSDHGLNQDRSPYSRDITVLSDGFIYGVGFGRIKVSGLTPAQAQTAMRRAMKRLFREEDVFLTVFKQRADLVYIVGSNAPGPIELPPNSLTLRQLLPQVTPSVDAQRLDVQLIRAGRVVGRSSYMKALDGDDPLGNTRILANDLVSVVPQETVRVWVVGPVKNPGELTLPIGATPYQAVAAAGGVTSLESDTRLAVRHGPNVSEFRATPDPGAQTPPLSEGDVVTVVAPELILITVGGKVSKPGDFVVSSGITALEAISKAAGPLADASLSRIFVFRHGEVLQYDLASAARGEPSNDPKLKGGDLVYLDENRRIFFVFGTTKQNGRFLMDDGKTYHAADALALAGGLSYPGSMRHVVLYRPNPNGKATIIQFNLDEFLKDGKQASNPELRPGDALLFSEPKGPSFAALNQVLNAYLFLHTIGR